MITLVYGTGAVGGFFGGLLARAGEPVKFVARGAQLEALHARGLTIDSSLLGRLDMPRIDAFASAREAGPADLVLVCVKTHQLAATFDDLAAILSDRTVVVPLQNGVEADDVLSRRFPNCVVLSAVVYVGATLEEPGVIRHVASGTIGIGARGAADAGHLPAVRDTLAKSGQAVHVSNDIQRERWRKLMWNAAFNTVSAITGREPADLLSRPESRQLTTAVMEEVLDVGRACGIDLRREDIDEQIAWTEKAAGLRTSTMVDRERGRTMESDALIGVVVRKARDVGIPAPTSAAVYALLKGLEAN